MKRTYLKVTAAAAILALSTSLSFPAMAAQRACTVNTKGMVVMSGNCLTGGNSLSGVNAILGSNTNAGGNSASSNCGNLFWNCIQSAKPGCGITGSGNAGSGNSGGTGSNNSGSIDSGNSGSNNSGSTGSGNSGSTSTSAYAAQVLELVNEERAKSGLAPLTLDASASSAAQTRAKEIVSTFSHTRPNGSSFSTALTEAGASYRSAGENIAYGQNSPEQVMNSWMNSSGHRANIMSSNYTRIGIGHYETADGTDYWVQLFLN